MEQFIDFEHHRGDFVDWNRGDGSGSHSGPAHKTRDVPRMSGFISIEGIARRYGTNAPIFDDLWLSMSRGEFVCVIGHSGCGKTTVLNILAGLDESTGLSSIGVYP